MATVSAHRAPLTETTIDWSHVPLVPQVALVGHIGDTPVAVIEQVGSAGYRASLCNGTNVGIFRTLDECKRAVAAAIDETSSHAASA